MKKVGELFSAFSSNLADVTSLENGGAGFLIPDYQRQYDWSEQNIKRLIYDCLNGFYRLTTNSDSSAFSFLGTLILVRGSPQEKEFKGKSISIVDGQQRLTTLTLLACALFEAIRRKSQDIDSDKSSEDEWLKLESEHQLSVLRGCAVGRQFLAGDKVFPFPRITRTEDSRGSSTASSEYKSPVANFLTAFANFSSSAQTDFDPPVLGDGRHAKKLTENYLIIRGLVENLNDQSFYEDTECEIVPADRFVRPGCKSILEKLDDAFQSDSDRDSAVSKIVKTKDYHDLYRLLLFASYLTTCVVLTRVETQDESAAFDIFDSLNTTGEPLTAIETLKPQVIKFETNRKKPYPGSASELAFQDISENLDELHIETEAKQKATKETLIDFALYLEGHKLSKDLGDQRNYLRTKYDAAKEKGPDSAVQFIQAIAETARFRRYYWEDRELGQLGSFHSPKSVQEAQLLCGLISSMNTSLILPIVRRYWSNSMLKSGDSDFMEVLRAITAFLVLRRAATGATAGIDAEFRSIMAPPGGKNSGRKLGLCAGVDHSNQLLTPTELKDGLRKLLSTGKHKIDGRSPWVKRVADNPLADQSKPLSRFMLLVSAHHAVADSANPGLWTRSGVKKSHKNATLTFEHWNNARYATVEHIAPDSNKGIGWDQTIYENGRLKHTLGNLVPLPAAENSSIGNQSWSKKKKFYLALSETTDTKQQERIAEAEADGIIFSKPTKKLLEEGECLPLLDPLRSVDDWTAELIRIRSVNVAELVWDELWPWLS